MKSPGNIPASVWQRLLNRARSDRRPFNELLQYYAMERFLYRLSQSAHANRFILKGALMLRVWRSPEIRPTMINRDSALFRFGTDKQVCPWHRNTLLIESVPLWVGRDCHVVRLRRTPRNDQDCSVKETAVEKGKVEI